MASQNVALYNVRLEMASSTSHEAIANAILEPPTQIVGGKKEDQEAQEIRAGRRQEGVAIGSCQIVSPLYKTSPSLFEHMPSKKVLSI